MVLESNIEECPVVVWVIGDSMRVLAVQLTFLFLRILKILVWGLKDHQRVFAPKNRRQKKRKPGKVRRLLTECAIHFDENYMLG